MDGVGEWTTTAIGAGRGHDLRLTDEIRFPHSLGLLYSAFTAFLGFEVNEGEYKVMGMAPYGVPRFVDEVGRLVRRGRRRRVRAGSGLFLVSLLDRHGPSRPSSKSCSAHRAARAPFFTEAYGVPVLFRRRSRQLSRLGAREPALRRHRRQHPGRHRRDPAAMARARHAGALVRRGCAWQAASRSTAWPTAGSCARRRSPISTCSQPPATAARRSARRCSSSIRSSGSRAGS